jgi:hypothetical protein
VRTTSTPISPQHRFYRFLAFFKKSTSLINTMKSEQYKKEEEAISKAIEAYELDKNKKNRSVGASIWCSL